MKHVLIICLLTMAACAPSFKGAPEQQIAWDSIKYTNTVIPEPAGLLRMGK